MDEIRCPLCGKPRTLYMDTLVCLNCDKNIVADLTWCIPSYRPFLRSALYDNFNQIIKIIEMEINLKAWERVKLSYD